jgi:hypothetical protein
LNTNKPLPKTPINSIINNSYDDAELSSQSISSIINIDNIDMSTSYSLFLLPKILNINFKLRIIILVLLGLIKFGGVILIKDFLPQIPLDSIVNTLFRLRAELLNLNFLPQADLEIVFFLRINFIRLILLLNKLFITSASFSDEEHILLIIILQVHLSTKNFVITIYPLIMNLYSLVYLL